MGKRRTKEGKDAIAQRLRHIALIAMHRIHHQLQRGINNRAGFFGVESFNQRGGAFEVGKKGGDGLAFALATSARFYRCLLSANPLSEMFRRVSNRF